MLFFPYKKLVIKTQMNSKKIFNAFDKVTFIDVWFEENHKAFFWGSLSPESNKFKLKLNDNTTMLSYIIKVKIDEKAKSSNLIISIRWSMFQMIIFSYFFFIEIIMILGFILMILLSFDPKGILMGIILLTTFFFFNIGLSKKLRFKVKQESIIRKLLKLTNGKIVFTNKY